MANDLRYLAKRMNAYAKRVERNAPEIVSQVAMAIGPVLVYATPVDTSRARANWQAGVGTIPTEYLFPPPSTPPSASYGGPAAIAAILAAADNYRGGSYIAIVNNSPYIQRLNNGWSAQAPSAFVQLAVMAGIRSMRNVRILRA